jgi:hypothetical protein
MYVSVLKNRMFENKFLRENGQLFDENIMPLIEMISLKIGKTEYSVQELIDKYDSYFNYNYFLDFFTFSEEEFKKFDAKKTKFSISIRDEKNYDYLNDLLMIVVKSKRGIPTISIKNARDFLLNEKSILDLIKKLQLVSDIVAVRIKSNVFGNYFVAIDSVLRETDYLFYDIDEDSIESKFFDLELIKQTNSNYKTIIINSPRQRKFNNSSYIDGGYTGLIDNSIRSNYASYGFDGYADYSGIKNVLPTDGGNGQGAALGMFFIASKNKFFTIVNKDTKQGASGHHHVISLAFGKFAPILNPTSHCPAFNYIDNVFRANGKPGSWGQWKYVTILRYISEIKKSTI